VRSTTFSTLGVFLAEDLPPAVANCLTDVQHDCSIWAVSCRFPATTRERRARRTARVRSRALQRRFEAAEGIILPAGTRAASLARRAHVCRRAERALVRLAQTDAVGEPARKYLNRLSDPLFVLARVLNRSAEREDVMWRKDRRHAG
jgi:cob(I)alamin adenosyltransferase